MHHYFVSELLIVLVGLWAARAMWQGRNYSAMLGFLCFVIAAGIGVFRFGFGQIEALANIHKTAGLLGGLAGIWLLVVGVLIKSGDKRVMPARTAVFFLALFIVRMEAFWAILLLILGAAALPLAVSYKAQEKKVMWGLGAAIMLPLVTVVRQSEYLGPDLSWHLFHSLVAAWLLVLGLYFGRRGNAT